MAYKELMIVVARLVWLFDMRLAPGRSEGEGRPEAGCEEWETSSGRVSRYR